MVIQMADIFVRLRGVPEDILDTLINQGYYKTKSEAIRAGILELGKEYALLKSSAYYKTQLQDLTRGKKLTIKQVKDKLEKLEE